MTTSINEIVGTAIVGAIVGVVGYVSGNPVLAAVTGAAVLGGAVSLGKGLEAAQAQRQK